MPPPVTPAEPPTLPAPEPMPQPSVAETHGGAAAVQPVGGRLALLSLLALGVVYGDIGTSPLYALRECFSPVYGFPATERVNVFGVLSLVTWAIVLMVAVKYIVFILRADNKGEGGIMALLALVLQRHPRKANSRRRFALVALGLFGAALLYGDGIITPPVSVLGAMEGLIVVTPTFGRYIVPLTFVILTGLFLVQRFGTHRIGFLFGPIVFVWFVTIAVLGVSAIVREPSILLAANPWYALKFFFAHGLAGVAIFGTVVLAVTGAEALYADMGHFGRRPIRLDFFALVLPALLLNYYGQGALLLRDPTAAANPFYLLAPRWFLYPLIGIATMAAIIASQALISGAFSMTQQAVQLGYVPRMKIIHTSAREAGQIYIPEINAALMIGCLVLVVTFKSAGALAAAYGVAVTGTMVITTLLFAVVARGRWGWSVAGVVTLTASFLALDLTFFGANILKVGQGGWVPLAVAAVVFVLMTTWKRGRVLLSEILHGRTMPVDLLIKDIARSRTPRVPGTAVFMTSRPGGTPVVLLHHLKHNKVVHEQVILLSVQFAEVPHVDGDGAVSVERLGEGFYFVQATFGFMQTPDVPRVMERLRDHRIHVPEGDTSYFLGREQLILTGQPGMARWRKRLFLIMSRNARPATEFFCLPPNRVVELGAQIEF